MKEGLEERKFTGSLARTIIISIVILILVTEIVTGIIGYIEFTVVLGEQYKETSSMVAHTTYRMIDNANILQYLNTNTKDYTYQETERRLQKLTDASGCRVIYIAAVDENFSHRTYIFDVCSVDSGYSPYEIGYTDDIREENAEDYVARERQGNFSASSYLTEIHDFAQRNIAQQREKFDRAFKKTRNFSDNRRYITRRLVELAADSLLAPLDNKLIAEICHVTSKHADTIVFRYKNTFLKDIYDRIKDYQEDKDI